MDSYVKISLESEEMDNTKKSALKIIKTLSQKGFKAYYAGGSVRDMLLKQPFKDIDIATSAKPDEIMKLFKRTIPVGLQYGVVMVLIDRIPFEVTTFRKDGPYHDGRHPDKVEFTDEKEDVMRRDFTINGILYDPITEEIIDYVEGQKDLQNKVIRAIGDPVERFKEDKLRMLRAIRFAARLSYQIELGTWNAIKIYCKNISEVSAERIRDEVIKILTEGQASVGIRLLDQSGLLDIILPEVSRLKDVGQTDDPDFKGDLLGHTLLLLDKMEKPSKELGLAVLLKHIGWDIAKSVCDRLMLSKKERDHVLTLIQQQQYFIDLPDMRESDLKRFLRQDFFEDHLELHRLEVLASHGSLDTYNFCVNKLVEYQSGDEDQLRPDKLVSGDMLIKLGFKPGPYFKRILESAENAQLEGVLETQEEAVEYVKTYYADLLDDDPGFD